MERDIIQYVHARFIYVSQREQRRNRKTIVQRKYVKIVYLRYFRGFGRRLRCTEGLKKFENGSLRSNICPLENFLLPRIRAKIFRDISDSRILFLFRFPFLLFLYTAPWPLFYPILFAYIVSSYHGYCDHQFEMSTSVTYNTIQLKQ